MPDANTLGGMIIGLICLGLAVVAARWFIQRVTSSRSTSIILVLVAAALVVIGGPGHAGNAFVLVGFFLGGAVWGSWRIVKK